MQDYVPHVLVGQQVLAMLPGAHSPLQLSANWHVLPSGGLQLSIGERHRIKAAITVLHSCCHSSIMPERRPGRALWRPWQSQSPSLLLRGRYSSGSGGWQPIEGFGRPGWGAGRWPGLLRQQQHGAQHGKPGRGHAAGLAGPWSCCTCAGEQQACKPFAVAARVLQGGLRLPEGAQTCCTAILHT